MNFINRDGKTRRAVPPGDPAALAAALERLIRAPDLRLRLGAAGSRRVRQDFRDGHRQASA